MLLRDELYNLLYSRFWPSFASKPEHVSITALSKVSKGVNRKWKLPIQAVKYVILKILKIIIIDILPGSNRNELKYPLQWSFFVPLNICEVASSNLAYFALIRKKATVLDGPWSATQVSSTKKTWNVWTSQVINICKQLVWCWTGFTNLIKVEEKKF